jgi:exonuclease III
MKVKSKRNNYKARAYPSSDANSINAKNARAFPPSDDRCDKNQNQGSQSIHQLRIATWNLGSLTGRGQELAETLKRRNINICCIQETRWKGSKSRDLGQGYQLVYHGIDNKQNGVGIVLDRHLKSRIVNIDRRTDRLITVKLALDDSPILNVICAYAPQVGCSKQEKDEFWEEMDDVTTSIPPEEHKFVLGDLNGHVGERDTTRKTAHGGYGYGCPNPEGERILEFASCHDLTILNTTFQKKSEHLITYKSGGKCSQIDFIMADSKLRTGFKDCKVIPGEALTSQHRILVGIYKLPKPIKSQVDKTVRIKWKELASDKSDPFREKLNEYLIKDMEKTYENANSMWSNFENECKSHAKSILGISKGGISTNKDPTWWNSVVKESLKTKKDLFKTWQESESEEDLMKYKDAKKLAKKIVAQTRANSREGFYAKLEDVQTDSEIFKIAKKKHLSTQDVKRNKYIKDKNQNLLTRNDDINNRWFEYYKELMNEEFPREAYVPNALVEGPIREINAEEVKSAVAKMKNGKAVGPDEIPADFWKFIGPVGVAWLTRLFNTIQQDGAIPESWRLSHLVPFYKNKGDVTQCGNYRGIKLTSHTLKVWERILNRRILTMTTITPNQFGFTPSRSTTDAIQAVRILTEKHRLNKEDLHLIFIDLEKAFDRVPRELVWEALRAQALPECYITLIQDMYRNVRTKVKSPAGTSREFEVRVGVHQGSALSPLLFNLVMDYITRNIQTQLPWNLLYADDVVLIAKTPDELQTSLSAWVNALEKSGLKVNRTKTEHMECCFSNGNNPNGSSTIYYPDATAVPKVTQFKYLGSVLTHAADIDADVKHRINVAWQKWRSLTGVLCDPRMPIRTKGKVYKTAVRPALMYGAECWTVKETHVQKIHTTEMKMLRWSGGATRHDKIRNEYIRGSFKVAPIPEKLSESRLRWYGHVMRRPDDYVVKKALNIPERKRGRGRPPSTWWTSMTRLLKKEQLPDPTTQDRATWRRLIRRADPT